MQKHSCRVYYSICVTRWFVIPLLHTGLQRNLRADVFVLFFSGVDTMIRAILTIPNDILITPCKSVTAFDKSLDTLVEDLFETMYSADGVGLAAPQVGVLLNVFVIDVRKGKKPHNPLCFINPSVLCTTLETLTEVEGCLSIPGVFLPVTRPARVGFRSRGVRGEYIHGDLRGMEARCFQHEASHLRGVLFTSEADGATASPER